jgi:predicted MPP superfamily phosphohydrolase
MIISILHLSDIHFKNGHNIILNRKEKLFDAIKNELKGKDALFILTSGDIAFSGKNEEYAIATNFYLDLVDTIRQYTELKCKLVFIPGNHDCLFDENVEEIRKLIIDKFIKEGLSDLNETLINKCCEPQANYFSFTTKIEELSEVSDITADHILSHALTEIVTFRVNGTILKFNLYNTSWISSIKERIGTMKFPIEYMNGKILQTDSQFSISLLHHPLNWHTPEYSKTFLDFLLKTSDVILTGHEHSSSTSRRSDIDNEYNTIHIESPALQESDTTESGFNLVNLNTETSEIQILGYKYDDSSTKRYIQHGDTNWKKIEKNKKLKSKDFQIRNDFKIKLEDPGTNYTHITADCIKLRDLFVPPYFQKIDIDIEKSKARLSSFILSGNVLDINNSNNEDFLKIILGPESSGKTAILKYYYSIFYDQNYYPIYISSDKITGIDVDKFKRIVAKEFKIQYDELDNTFENIDYKSIIILIDDFHNFTNTKAKVIFLKNLKKIFNKIIITGNELMMFESFKDKNGKAIEPYADFDWYMVKEFNPSLRAQLINNWYRLGREYMDREERNDFFRKVDIAKSNIDTIVGKNLVPSFPVYVLAILQGLETGESNTTSNKQHAYYYELLITNSLKRVLTDKEDIGFYMTLGKEYFYFLFKEKIRFKPISRDSFFKFLDNHKEDYRISKLNNDSALDILLKSRILKKDSDNNISIAYKYLYYYFVAKYLADNLDEDEIRRDIDLMADRVYRDEFSNIIIFLIHLARNNYVIKKLIEKSKAIYSSYTPINLEKDISFINDLQTSIPEAVLKSINIEEARQIELENEDRYEEIETQYEEQSLSESYELTEDISNLNQIAIITKALRTLDILGQLTKKYWGELKGDYKYNLAEETFLLGLRTLSFHFSLVDGNIQNLIDHIKKVLLKKYHIEDLTSTNVEAITGNLIFSLCSTATFAILKRIANAIGSEKLSDTYYEIEHNHPYNSIALINAGIKLDHFLGFPMADLENLKIKNEKNILSQVVIRKFLIDHMYMYDLGFEKRQQICEKFDIKMEDQRLISATSQIKKK